ncbi:MAG: RT0821/Lpp0805 family surface protein [Rhodovibrionaceae bacterium]|nr:RT0821/Lpp0805 family surface protein [Rhodovibrionaceae bacterium]
MKTFLFIRGLVLAALTASPALSQVAIAGPQEEVEFARAVVKAKLETERTGVAIEWKNPESGKAGQMEILETQILDRSLPCRWYEWSVKYAAGSTIETEGKGCRLRSGEWLLEETAIIREQVRVEVPVEVVKPAPQPEPKDPMADVVFTRPDSMSSSNTAAPEYTEPVGGGSAGSGQQEN